MPYIAVPHEFQETFLVTTEKISSYVKPDEIPLPSPDEARAFLAELWAKICSIISALNVFAHVKHGIEFIWTFIKTTISEHPRVFFWISVALTVVLAVVALAAPAIALVLGLIGFGAGGVILGSIAAAWQSAIGAVAAGSLFALLQSLGATLGVAAIAGPLFIPILILAAIAFYIWFAFMNH